MAFAIRRAGRGDEAMFARFDPDVFDHEIAPDRLAAYLAAPGHLMVVAIEDGLVVGQCAGVVHRHPDKPTELYIDEVGTAATHRRRGIARAMLAELIGWGREMGCEEAWVGTEPDNVAARRLYEDLGTRIAGDPAEGFVMYAFYLS